MASFPTETIPFWAARNILDYFNSVRTLMDITEGPIQDDPRDGVGRTIGPTIARRILDARRRLPLEQFTDIRQIDNIRGIGENTMQDLLYTFGRPAAEFFQEFMFEAEIISRDNWDLLFFQKTFTLFPCRPNRRWPAACTYTATTWT